MPTPGARRLDPALRQAHWANRRLAALYPTPAKAKPWPSIAAVLLLSCTLSLLAACSDGPTTPPVAAVIASPPPTAAPSATATATDTLGVTPSPDVTPTHTPSPPPPPSATPAPPTRTATATTTPSPTPTLPVYDAAYVADVTIPDGTIIEPGTPFTKTWRLRNTGNAPWEEGTALALAAGEAMGAPKAVPVPATAPGETADVSVPMVAPAESGTHSAAWRLCRAAGCFGGAVTLQIVSRAARAVAGPTVGLPTPTEAVECHYIGNRNPSSLKFHRADCRWVKEMNEANKVCFATREEAIAAGYVPCKVCGP